LNGIYYRNWSTTDVGILSMLRSVDFTSVETIKNSLKKFKVKTTYFTKLYIENFMIQDNSEEGNRLDLVLCCLNELFNEEYFLCYEARWETIELYNNLDRSNMIKYGNLLNMTLEEIEILYSEIDSKWRQEFEKIKNELIKTYGNSVEKNFLLEKCLECQTRLMMVYDEFLGFFVRKKLEIKKAVLSKEISDDVAPYKYKMCCIIGDVYAAYLSLCKEEIKLHIIRARVSEELSAVPDLTVRLLKIEEEFNQVFELRENAHYDDFFLDLGDADDEEIQILEIGFPKPVKLIVLGLERRILDIQILTELRKRDLYSRQKLMRIGVINQSLQLAVLTFENNVISREECLTQLSGLENELKVLEEEVKERITNDGILIKSEIEHRIEILRESQTLNLQRDRLINIRDRLLIAGNEIEILINLQVILNIEHDELVAIYNMFVIVLFKCEEIITDENHDIPDFRIIILEVATKKIYDDLGSAKANENLAHAINYFPKRGILEESNSARFLFWNTTVYHFRLGDLRSKFFESFCALEIRCREIDDLLAELERINKEIFPHLSKTQKDLKKIVYDYYNGFNKQLRSEVRLIKESLKAKNYFEKTNYEDLRTMESASVLLHRVLENKIEGKDQEMQPKIDSILQQQLFVM
jgi:hypothetical protein